MEEEKGIKESQNKLIYDIDWVFVKNIAERMNENKSKYPLGNWKKDIDLASIEQALERHYIQYKIGDTSEDHLIAIVCNSMILNYHRKKTNE